MFKYNIIFPFQFFTQYYENTVGCYSVLRCDYECLIFLCALYKKGGVEEIPGSKTRTGLPPVDRFAVRSCVIGLELPVRVWRESGSLHAPLAISGYLVSNSFLISVIGLGPSSRTVLTTSVTTAPHFAPSDAETKVIRKRRSSRPMLFIKRLTMNIRFAAL